MKFRFQIIILLLGILPFKAFTQADINPVISDILREYLENFIADADYSELEKHGDKDDNLLSKDAFVKDVYNGMIGRRNNIREMIENNKIKSIYILFTAKPKTDTERIEDNNRIKETIELCNKGKVSLQIRQIDLNKHKCLTKQIIHLRSLVQPQ